VSVIVWDGKTLAADCQCTCAGLKYRVSKIRRLPDGTVLAWTGGADTGQLMAKWYEDGADVKAWPAHQANQKHWCHLVVMRTDGQVFCYEQYPSPIECLEAPMAWGAGRDFALGAMAAGADARKAVEIASQFSNTCGFGVEAFDLVERLAKAAD
jgi:ATP-dependent protease HslVU (ClpYQ) peptidase subunit